MALIYLRSIGQKYRMPPAGAISAREMPNPYMHQPLRYLDGRHADVQEWIAGPRADDAIELVMSRALSDGTATVFCYGGRHRSVAVVEIAAKRLRALGHEVEVLHMERDRWA